MASRRENYPADYGAPTGQQYNAAVSSEPSAPAANHGTILEQPDGLLWTGAPEDDPLQEWLNLPDDFFDNLEAVVDTSADGSQALQISGHSLFDPWSGDDTYSTSSQQDIPPAEHRNE